MDDGHHPVGVGQQLEGRCRYEDAGQGSQRLFEEMGDLGCGLVPDLIGALLRDVKQKLATRLRIRFSPLGIVQLRSTNTLKVGATNWFVRVGGDAAIAAGATATES